MTLREVLAQYGVRPDKRLGQHFLVSEGAISKIVARVEGCKGVLEVGPGPGVLTRPLTRVCESVVAVEVDARILPALRTYAPDARIVEADALVVDLALILAGLPEPRALVSNMPYNITGPLLDRFAQVRCLTTKAVLMMQKEVAAKIVAAPGDSGRGALSVVMQACFEIQTVCQVPAGAFLPPPKVDSTVLEFRPRPLVPGAPDLDAGFALVRSGFTQPRKTIANNLAAALGTVESSRRIEAAGLDRRLRPHQLTWEQWLALAR